MIYNHKTTRSYITKELSRYWHSNSSLISNLPIPVIELKEKENYPPRLKEVKLPSWGRKWGVNNSLLIPSYLSNSNNWQDVDWFSVIFWYMNSLAERSFEADHGPIHSYSIKLHNWDKKIWQYAWVNRIALFLREWAAFIENENPEKLFLPLPSSNIILTHDVDAVKKTLAIRAKQTAFHLFKCLKSFRNYQIKKGIASTLKSIHFLFSFSNYWQFEKIISIEEKYKVKSHFNFFAGNNSMFRSLKKKLFDPSYNIRDNKIKKLIKLLYSKGWTIGLHQSFDSWNSHEMMQREKDKLEMILGEEIKSCRQHWLRFSFKETWKIQALVGLKLDTTLGFNDTPALRNATALKISPWCAETKTPMPIKSLPNVLMDSQLFDYNQMNYSQRKELISYWINEISFVHGEASIIWHQRVLSKDYNWNKSFIFLLKNLKDLHQ